MTGGGAEVELERLPGTPSYPRTNITEFTAIRLADRWVVGGDDVTDPDRWYVRDADGEILGVAIAVETRGEARRFVVPLLEPPAGATLNGEPYPPEPGG